MSSFRRWIDMMVGHIRLIIVMLLFIRSVLATVHFVNYHLTYGEARSGIIAYLAQINRNSEYVGIRIPINNGTFEPLDTSWMESRSYDSAYSYYEKFVVEEKAIGNVDAVNGEYFWKIPGPLQIGSKLTVIFSTTYVLGINLVDNRYPQVILLHVAISDIKIVYSRFDGRWIGNRPHYESPAGIDGINVYVLEILSGKIRGSLNDAYPGDITETPPEDNPTRIYFSINNFLTLHSIRYDRN